MLFRHVNFLPKWKKSLGSEGYELGQESWVSGLPVDLKMACLQPQ